VGRGEEKKRKEKKGEKEEEWVIRLSSM